jgi:putative membrane protein
MPVKWSNIRLRLRENESGLYQNSQTAQQHIEMAYRLLLLIAAWLIPSINPSMHSFLEGMPMTKLKIAMTMLVLALPVTVRADDKVIEKRDPDQGPRNDTEFLARTLAANIAEIKIAERAVGKASDAEVKKFAREMLNDHTKARDELMDRAKAMKLAVVEGLETNTRNQIDQLSKLDGKAFDREYMRHMVNNHEKALKLYQSWAAKSQDKDLRELASRTIPTVKKQLEEARHLYEKVR